LLLLDSQSAGNRHLMAAQGAGNPQAPNKPSAVTRKEWGPNFSAASGDRKLMAVQGFKAPQLEPAKPKSPDSKRFTATTTTGTGAFLEIQFSGPKR
jgi:hypothetical protein